MMINIQDLVVKYDDFTAVDNISFSVNEGDIYGFIGSNGAGKTTTMRVMATLMLPASGKIFIDGIDVVEKPREVRKIIGYMPDFFGVYDNLRVWEYLDFFAGVYKINKKTKTAAFDKVLKLTRLESKRDSFVNHLSRGMKQRLGLARALLHNPKLLILDEPASGLDPRARVEFREILSSLSKTGVTILISSHILTELSDFCHTACILEKGKIVVQGNIETIAKKAGLSDVVLLEVENTTLEHIKNALGNIDCRIELIAEDKYHLFLPASRKIKSEALARLVRSGVEVSNFAVIKTNLEDVFMKLSKGELA